MKKLVIFGATGTTGLVAAAAAIKKGYNVTAFVRDPKKLPSNLRVKIIEGDVTNPEDVDAAVKDQDFVIDVIGTGFKTEPTTIMSVAATNILSAMKKYGVKRIVVSLSAFFFWDRINIPASIIGVHEDQERVHESLKKSDVDWVAICPPHISSEPAHGDCLALIDDHIEQRLISQFDLADIYIKALTRDDWVRHLIGMGYPQ